MDFEQALAQSNLNAASQRLAEGPDLSDRLAWWLQFGNACEGWIRFEWAYQLQEGARGADRRSGRALAGPCDARAADGGW